MVHTWGSPSMFTVASDPTYWSLASASNASSLMRSFWHPYLAFATPGPSLLTQLVRRGLAARGFRGSASAGCRRRGRCSLVACRHRLPMLETCPLRASRDLPPTAATSTGSELFGQRSIRVHPSSAPIGPVSRLPHFSGGVWGDLRCGVSFGLGWGWCCRWWGRRGGSGFGFGCRSG